MKLEMMSKKKRHIKLVTRKGKNIERKKEEGLGREMRE